MKRSMIAGAIGLVGLCVLAISLTATADDAAKKAEKPADRVVVMYFHRTQRCPTCLRMGGYAEEAVLQGFAKQIKDGTVEFHYVDFQDPRNAALAKGYKIEGPTLIVVKIVDNKAKEYKDLTEIWAKNRDKEAFLKYVRDNVNAYLANH
jgi:acylphosphatase